MKIVPFSETCTGVWEGQFGGLTVQVRRREGAKFWRGPDGEFPHLVLDRPDAVAHPFAVRGRFSGFAHTLPAALEMAERSAWEEQGVSDLAPCHAMTLAEREAEEEARRASWRWAVEADRIAFANGWPMAMDALPELRAFAEEEGIAPEAGNPPLPR